MRRKTKKVILKIVFNVLFFICVILASAIPIILSNAHKNKVIGQSTDVSQIRYESMPDVNLDDDIKELNKVVKDVEEKRLETKKQNSKKFKLTAYCACSKCCGKWSGGNTASGTKPTQGRTIAVDTRVIPFGAKVVINGHTYIAEDTGSAIKGNKIDVYFDNHEEALQFGVKYADVTIVK